VAGIVVFTVSLTADPAHGTPLQVPNSIRLGRGHVNISFDTV